jgi:hypothetical protein
MTQPHAMPRLPGADELQTSDGEPMESERHRRQMLLLIESLEHAFGDRDDFYVGGDMFLYFSEAQTRKNDFRGPDVFVVLDTERRERKAWVVWEEDGKTRARSIFSMKSRFSRGRRSWAATSVPLMWTTTKSFSSRSSPALRNFPARSVSRLPVMLTERAVFNPM